MHYNLALLVFFSLFFNVFTFVEMYFVGMRCSTLHCRLYRKSFFSVHFSDCGNDTYDPVRKIRKHNRIEVFRTLQRIRMVLHQYRTTK